MTSLDVKNKHQKDMCHNEIGLCAQNTNTNSIFNNEQKWGGLAMYWVALLARLIMVGSYGALGRFGREAELGLRYQGY